MMSPSRHRPAAAALIAFLLAFAASCRSPQAEGPAPEEAEPARLVVLGPCLTLDPAAPEGAGLVADRGRIVYVSRDAAPEEHIGGSTTVLEVPPGGVCMPGIIESHAHLLSVGRGRRRLDVQGSSSPEAVAAAVAARARALPPGTWIRGRGWNQETWEDRSFPDRRTLDEAAPEHPVLLTRVDGHAAWVNSRALELAGVGAGTEDPPGGEIVRGEDGRPTGVLIDNAVGPVARVAPPSTDREELEKDYLAAQDRALSLGITTLVDAGSSDGELLRLSELYERRLMKLRVYAMLSVDDARDLQRALTRPRVEGLHGDRLTVRAIKLYADGALGSRGAWLLEPYADRPDHMGLSTLPPAFIEEAAVRALKAGFQVCVHAIGDRANREVLDAYERAFARAPEEAAEDPRFRIEHAQIVDAGDIPRFAELGVIPSMQGCHATSDGPWVPARLGPGRTGERAYPWRALLDAGSFIPNGTDAPVEPLSPWNNLFCTTFRGERDGSGVYTPHQRMNRHEALLSLTAWGARGIFAEDRRGRLRPGMQADLVVLDRDPRTCSVWEMPEIRVLATVIAGEVVYRAPAPATAGGGLQ